MPLIIICGFPSSGKSKRSKDAKCYFEEKHSKQVIIVGDHGIDRNQVYNDSKNEKDVRGSLKSGVQRVISKEDVVIVDSLNYIKGFRYELFCVAKSAQTPHCIIHCAVSPETAKQWNASRSEQERYTNEIFDGLVMRFEAPDSRNRWDSPLFTVLPDDELPCQQIYDAVYLRKAPPPNMSTVSQPLSSTSFLHELDKITQDIVMAVLNAQKMSLPGDEVSLPKATEKIKLVRHVTASELRRWRQQFVSYTKQHPVENTDVIPNMFVQYLNNSLV
ncbi:protein KTI12 homolog [Anneissia japonica]|uniref:protein KTI12 homolog n=1 Tax=Anneissia japonica TaxID=1529436 RepID=UPI00142563CF|nr:protein KTI12 homolog [Anneissia japonica]